jgi:hypothetical protein
MTTSTIHCSAMLETLRAARSASPQANLYLLLDPYLRMPPLEAALSERECAIVPLSARDQVPAIKRPLLMRFRDDEYLNDERLLQETLEMGFAETAVAREFSGAGRAIGGWLLSRAPIREVARHLRVTMDQHDPTGVRRYIRLGDPRVLASVWHQLALPDRQALLGPIDDWFIFDHSGVWTRLSRDANGHRAVEPWRPTVAQWRMINRMQCVNSIVLRLRRKNTSVPPEPARIDALVSDAQRRGFTDADDLRTFAMYGMRFGERFLEHPRVSALLTQALSESRVLEDAFADVASDEEWEKVIKDMPNMESTRNGALTRHG